MEKSEPTLVPEWLKGTGNVTGGGSSSHHLASSSLHPDESGVALPTRNRTSLNTDYDSCHSPTPLDRTSSVYFRRSSSSNGSMGHDKDSAQLRSYSNFGRSYRDRDYKDSLDFREKDRSTPGDQREHNFSDADIFANRLEKDLFRRSQSMITGKRGEVRVRRVVADATNSGNHNGVAGGNKIINIHKATFERDFPSLGTEEKQGVDRVASPGLSSAAQSLPMGTSAMIMGNGWTSALAEVPVMAGNNNMSLLSVPQTASSNSGLLAPSTTTGLNMAETLAQAPLRARTAPQLSVETQRLEELAIKQSRQLIPMTPSMPKVSVLNSEKQKPKASTRSEMSMANKTGQQLSSAQPVNHPLRGARSDVGGTARSDVAKTSNGGKLLVLKAARENGIPPAMKDSSSPTNTGRTANNPVAVVASSVGLAPSRSQSNSKGAAAERNSIALSANKTSFLEKKPMNSHTQSRNDFFNLMRKKTLGTNSSAAPDSVPAASLSPLEKSGEMTSEVINVVSPQGSNIPTPDHSSPIADHIIASNGDADENSQRLVNNGEKQSSSGASLYPDEEEAAFLRSLGWEEDAGEEEGLTEEEINAFYQEYMKVRPSSKLCQGMHQQTKLQLDSGSGASSSESKSEV